MRSALIPLALLPGCCSVDLTPRPVPTVRPVVGSDTGTAGAGGLNLEVGARADPRDASFLSTELQWGVAENVDLFVAWIPIVREFAVEGSTTGTGDSAVGVRYRFLEEEVDRPAMLFDIAVSIPTADANRGLGSGTVDFFSGFAATKTIGGVATTAFYQLGLLTNPEGGTDPLNVFSLQAAAPFSELFHVFGELAAILETNPTRDIGSATLGGAVNFNPYLTLDFGLALVGDETQTDVQFFVGVTWGALVPRGQRSGAL